MFCPKCGTNVADGGKFCPSCGASMQAPQQPAQPSYQAPQQPAYQAPTQPTQPAYQPAQPQYQPQQPQYAYAQTRTAVANPNKKRNLMIIIIAAIVVVAAVVLIIVLTGGKGGASSYEAVVEQYLDGFSTNNEKKIESLFLPEYKDYFNKMYSVMDLDGSFLENCDDWYDDYGRAIKSYKIEDVELEDVGDSEIATVNAMMGTKISAAVYVSVYVEYKDGGDDDFDFGIVKNGNKWYIIEVC